MTEKQTAVPADIIAKVLELGPIEWAATEPQSPFLHGAEMARSCQITMTNFNLQGDQPMHFLAKVGESESNVMGYIGISPNSAIIARTFVGLWNKFHTDLSAGLVDAAVLGFDTPSELKPAAGHDDGASLLDLIMESIRDVVAEASVDEPAGRGAGYNIQYDEAELRSIIASIIREQPIAASEVEGGNEGMGVCPSCGAHNVFLRRPYLDARRHVECRVCKMRGPTTTEAATAVAGWNALTEDHPPGGHTIIEQADGEGKSS